MEGYEDLRLTTREKDIIALRVAGFGRSVTASRLGIDITEIERLEEKVRRSYRSDFLNLSHLDRSARKDMKFRKLVARAMNESGLRTIEEMEDFLGWAIGEDYQVVPYQEWPLRIMRNCKLLGISEMSPVKEVVRAAVEIWKHNRILIPR